MKRMNIISVVPINKNVVNSFTVQNDLNYLTKIHKPNAKNKAFTSDIFKKKYNLSEEIY